MKQMLALYEALTDSIETGEGKVADPSLLPPLPSLTSRDPESIPVIQVIEYEEQLEMHEERERCDEERRPSHRHHWLAFSLSPLVFSISLPTSRKCISPTLGCQGGGTSLLRCEPGC